jgi:hypothetical protein
MTARGICMQFCQRHPDGRLLVSSITPASAPRAHDYLYSSIRKDALPRHAGNFRHNKEKSNMYCRADHRFQSLFRMHAHGAVAPLLHPKA